jgi:hypothetical protein
LPVLELAVFSRAEALEKGWTQRKIRTQLEHGKWKQLTHGRYVDAVYFEQAVPQKQPALLSMAVGHKHELVIHRDSAACLQELRVLRTPTRVASRHKSAFVAADLTTAYGINVTKIPVTVIEITRFLGVEAGIVTADSAIERGETTNQELCGQVRRLPRRPRLTGRTSGRPRGFLWRKQRVIGEADGLKKYGTNERDVRAKLRAERIRQREFEDAGYVSVRWLWEEILQTPDLVAQRVTHKLAERNNL